MNRRSTIKEERLLSEVILTIQLHLNLSDKELANILGLSLVQLMERKQTQSIITHQDANAVAQGILLVRLYQGLHAVVGDDINTMRYWMNSNNTFLDNTNVLFILKPGGLFELVAYIESFIHR